MKTPFPMLAAAIVIGAPIAAHADNDTGLIKAIDIPNESLTLESGASYVAPKSVDLTVLKVGEKVMVTYAKTGSTVDVSAIAPVP
jgi:Protein of unknown function (DUF1344)